MVTASERFRCGPYVGMIGCVESLSCPSLDVQTWIFKVTTLINWGCLFLCRRGCEPQRGVKTFGVVLYCDELVEGRTDWPLCYCEHFYSWRYSAEIGRLGDFLP